MKRFYSISVALLVALTLVSCKDDPGIDPPEGHEGKKYEKYVPALSGHRQ
ncbi:MAG: hypothetical protein LUE26_03100 [Alistipes sp.]|nr:hypothetical protein [Alistipes sp.]